MIGVVLFGAGELLWTVIAVAGGWWLKSQWDPAAVELERLTREEGDER